MPWLPTAEKTPTAPVTRAIEATGNDEEEPDEPPGFNLKQVDPVPTVLLSTHHGSCHSQVLPDSGADISAAGEHVLPPFNEHKDNLLPFEFTSRAANGQRMHAIEKMHACFQLAGNEYEEVFTHLHNLLEGNQGFTAPITPLPPSTTSACSFTAKNLDHNSLS